MTELQESTLAEERAKEAQKAARQAEQLLNDSLQSIHNAWDAVSSKVRLFVWHELLKK